MGIYNRITLFFFFFFFFFVFKGDLKASRDQKLSPFASDFIFIALHPRIMLSEQNKSNHSLVETMQSDQMITKLPNNQSSREVSRALNQRSNLPIHHHHRLRARNSGTGTELGSGPNRIVDPKTRSKPSSLELVFSGLSFSPLLRILTWPMTRFASGAFTTMRSQS